MSTKERQIKVAPVISIPNDISEEITDLDQKIFFQVVSEELNDIQKSMILNPPAVYHSQQSVLAVHWHPEFIPMPLIEKRIKTMFPNKKQELIIPTQHNELISYNGYSGVEVDCYSAGFNQKVQLLFHFETSNLENAHILRGMLGHTFKYRSSQLFEFINAITKPNKEWIEQAAKQTGASDELIDFVYIYVKKIEKLLDININKISKRSIKNKILRNFFDCLRQKYGHTFIDRVKNYLNAIKQIVKLHFPLHYFYRTSEIIEEARSLKAGIVIPHPEQFWPILLANYDVDGVEVWNPQSRRYTEFLVSMLNEKNQQQKQKGKDLLIFMGDDTHMGEKIRDPKEQDKEKAKREIGVQPAWYDLDVRKKLITGNICKENIIQEYKERLAR